MSVHGVSVTKRTNERKEVLSRFRKKARVGADVTTCGRLFQRRLPATGKARSPTVMSRVRIVESVAAVMMTMNEVVDGWKRQHVGSNQIGTEERDCVDIDKQARLT